MRKAIGAWTLCTLLATSSWRLQAQIPDTLVQPAPSQTPASHDTPAGQTSTAIAPPPAAVSNAPAQPAVTLVPAPQRTYLVPQGTKILLSLKSAVNTKSARPGDGVYLISTFPVVAENRVLIPAGVYVQGSVDQVVRPGHVKGRAQVGMHFTSLIFPNGTVVDIPGQVNSLPGSSGPTVKNSEGTIEQASNKGRDLGNVLKGAAIGAEGGVIGGAATGSLGPAIGYGTLAGALAGGIYTLFQRGDDVNIPQGTVVEMVLQRPLLVQEENVKAEDSSVQTTYAPASQEQPMQKPRKPSDLLCPSGTLGCN